MKTRKLLWGMTWESSWRAVLIGGLLGAISGALRELIELISNGGRVPVTDVSGGFNIGLWLFFMLLVAGIYAIGGVLIGLVAGPIGGLLCALLSWWFFFPLEDSGLYRRVVIVAGVIYAVIATVCALQFRGAATGNPFSSQDLFWCAVTAGVGAVFVSQRLARWYECAIKTTAS